MQALTLKLLGTSHCHLCEEAEIILNQALQNSHLQHKHYLFHKVDVIEDHNLFTHYGIKIPVIQIAIHGKNSVELCWPFNVEDLTNLLADYT